jgi:hypothetical protein
MRTFDIYFKHKKKTVRYSQLTGKKALKIAEDLDKKGFLIGIVTEANHIVEGLTLKEMKEVIL